MSQRFGVLSLVAAACVAFSASAHAERAGGVVVDIIDSHGRVFQQVPAKAESHAYRAYLDAERDARYRIRIRNLTNARVGVVVTVDGRNIISGARSDLGNSEPMYILDRWATQEYSGWRANLSEVNEFYFTDWKDSYAEAFGDASARGVIAVAAYREKESNHFSQRDHVFGNIPAPIDSQPAPAPAPPPGDSSASAGARDQAAPSIVQGEPQKKAERSDEAGTGYGDRRTEYVTEVDFKAEPSAVHRVFLKYEWHETLCSRHILNCEDPPNRFWPNTYGFAPPPPGRQR
jgi:hypothetical protein